MVDVDRSIAFVDAYIHMYALDRYPYAWLQDPGTQGHNELLGDYKMIRSTIGLPERMLREFYGANVAKCVHVEADFPGSDPVEETRWLERTALKHGFPTAIVAYCDLERADVGQQLDRHLAASARVRGVRVRSHPDDPHNAAFRRGYEALGARGLSYELNASPGRLLSGRDLAVAYPNVQVVVGHAGFPVQRDEPYMATWRREISALGEVDNVAVKISGFGMVDQAWSLDSIRPLILHCIDAFGPDRVVFGSNWPVDMLRTTYLEQTDAFRVVLAAGGFSREDQAKMLCRNAERIYRI